MNAHTEIMRTLKNDIPALIRLLHAEPDSYPYERAIELFEEAKSIARPRFLIEEVPVRFGASEEVYVGDQLIESRIVAHRLKDRTRAFVYISSCGPEIAARTNTSEDLMDNYILDQISYVAYLQAQEALLAYVDKGLHIERFNLLAPGAIIDWNIAETKKLFAVLEDEYPKLNLRVLDSGLIDPLKSTAGILVENESDFCSCDICQRANCPNRQAPFDEERYQEMINL